jgi:WD40 repeat protein
VPRSVQEISVNNLDQVVELSRWGKELINNAVFSQDGSMVALVSSVHVALYSLEEMEEFQYIETESRITDIAFSWDGEFLAVGLSDNTAQIWKIAASNGICGHRLAPAIEVDTSKL